MPLTFRETGRRADGDRLIVTGEWFDASDPARVLRSELAGEADGLERRAADLRRQATTVPDQVRLDPPPDGADFPDAAAVAELMARKAAAIAANLGL